MKQRNQRNRIDHLLPQGYLEGFTDPDAPGTLSVFDIKKRRWFESGPPAVGASRGYFDYFDYFDYSLESRPDQTADESFRRFEEDFPNVRRQMVAAGFTGWEQHLDFLLGYAQMLRARTQMFREQELKSFKGLELLRLKGPAAGEQSTFEYEPVPAEHRQELYRNMAITKVREQIANGPSWFGNFRWFLRYSDALLSPVVTCDNPIIVSGPVHDAKSCVNHENALIFFPLCWQACLIGSHVSCDPPTDIFDQRTLARIRSRYLTASCRFAYSPRRLDPLR